MKLPTTLAVAMLPLLIAADESKSWLFETTSGRAQGIGTRSCQRFYMKTGENWTLKLEPGVGKMKARSASAEPQGGWGNSGGNPGWADAHPPPPSPQNGGGDRPSSGGTWNPTPNPDGRGSPSNNGAWNPPTPNQPNRQPPPPSNNGEWIPPQPQNNNRPPPPNTNRPTPPPNNGGLWNGPVSAPSAPQQGGRPLRCCVRVYLDEACKNIADEGCVVDKKEEMFNKGSARRDGKSFNVVCA
ncbi:hypothetical protein FKW77_002803 [Venturia effusa]|uniref:Uncharacterized protein n=1 Tax=Venturia effusa TaxID=50376 RepID=A0A517LQY0_9PEZI|nr:hypothetical protein FKW77_002803 [Venturia effusa]